MATARELLALLLTLSDKELEEPLSVPGHYGEHNELGLPSPSYGVYGYRCEGKEMGLGLSYSGHWSRT